MNIMENPSYKDITISIPILAVVTQFISNKIMLSNTKNKDAEPNSATNSMNMMNNIMPFMSGFFCLMFPIGVGLYWVAGSLFRIIQGIFINMYFNKIGIDAIAAKNIEKRNKKLARKGIDPNSTKMQELAKTRTSSIKSNAHVPSNTSSSKGKSSKQDLYINKDLKSGSSISDYANMLNREYFENDQVESDDKAEDIDNESSEKADDANSGSEN
jgi:YidC/Oxa1 family membrane protein insertase